MLFYNQTYINKPKVGFIKIKSIVKQSVFEKKKQKKELLKKQNKIM